MTNIPNLTIAVLSATKNLKSTKRVSRTSELWSVLNQKTIRQMH